MSRPASASMGPYVASKRRRTVSSRRDSPENNLGEDGDDVAAQSGTAAGPSSETPHLRKLHHHYPAKTPKRARLGPVSAAAAAAVAHVVTRTVSIPVTAATVARQQHVQQQQQQQQQQQHYQHQPPLPYQQKQQKKKNSLRQNDDQDGHLVYSLGDGLFTGAEFPQGRYKILSDLGEGTFGKVVECWDRRMAIRVAVKIVRSVAKYRDAARLEIEVLEHLEANDPDGLHHCVRLLDWFDHDAHVCIVFEKLGPSLYDQLRRNRFRPFSLELVRGFAYQLLESVSYVHSLTLIHTDLKPENILLADPEAATAVNLLPANPQPSPRQNSASRCVSNAALSQAPSLHRRLRTAVPAAAIKLIDFGSATFQSQHHSAVISTRHYRAPEVILGLGWTYPCDIWSVGCILVELYTGQALFQTHENLEHLAMMHVVLGPIPDSMIGRADSYSQKYFKPATPCALPSPHPSDRPPSGSTKRRSTKVANLATNVQRRKRPVSLSGDDLPASRQEDFPSGKKCKAYYNAQLNVGKAPATLSSASASGSAVAAVVEDYLPRDKVAASESTRSLNWPAGASSVASVRAVRRVKSLADIVKSSENHEHFLDLLRRLLAFEPRHRCTASEALNHPFFREDPIDVDMPPSQQAVTGTMSSDGESPICGSQEIQSGRSLRRNPSGGIFNSGDAGLHGTRYGGCDAVTVAQVVDTELTGSSPMSRIAMPPPSVVPSFARDAPEGSLRAAGMWVVNHHGYTWRNSGTQSQLPAFPFTEESGDAVTFTGPVPKPETTFTHLPLSKFSQIGYACSDISAEANCPHMALDRAVEHSEQTYLRKEKCSSINGKLCATPVVNAEPPYEIPESCSTSKNVDLDVAENAHLSYVIDRCIGDDESSRDLCSDVLLKDISKGNYGDETRTQAMPTAGELSDVTCGPNVFVSCEVDLHVTPDCMQPVRQTSDDTSGCAPGEHSSAYMVRHKS